jgi:hypothetical protein
MALKSSPILLFFWARMEPILILGGKPNEAHCVSARTAGVVEPGNHIEIIEAGRYRIAAFRWVKRGNGPVGRSKKPCETGLFGAVL